MKNLKAAGLINILILLIFFSGCQETGNNMLSETDKPVVIATLFPQYDFVRQIAGDRVTVTLLLPPGVEPHSYEPSPRDIANIQKADMFVYTGESMEPWAERIVGVAEGTGLLIVDASLGIELMEEGDHHEHHHHEEDDHETDQSVENTKDFDENSDSEHHHSGKDPHFWLDPILAQVMVDHIVEGLCRIDPDNEYFYKENGLEYKQQLNDLHEKIESSLAGLKNRTILYGGHFAFGYFAARYNLEHVSPYAGFAPDAEPTPGNIAELIKRVEESNARIIYYEELIEPKVAAVIAEQTGAEMVLLHGAHNVTTDELESGITYVYIMEENLDKLLKGLK